MKKLPNYAVLENKAPAAIKSWMQNVLDKSFYNKFSQYLNAWGNLLRTCIKEVLFIFIFFMFVISSIMINNHIKNKLATGQDIFFYKKIFPLYFRIFEIIVVLFLRGPSLIDRSMFISQIYGSVQIQFCMQRVFTACAGFSNIPGKYENVVFIIKNPWNRNKCFKKKTRIMKN